MKKVVCAVCCALVLCAVLAGVWLQLWAQRQAAVLTERKVRIAQAVDRAGTLDGGTRGAGGLRTWDRVGDLAVMAQQLAAAGPAQPAGTADAAALAALCDSAIQAAAARHREQQRLSAIKASVQNAAGYSGRFIVPALGVDVMVITASSMAVDLQRIVDMKNTAALMVNCWGKGEMLLADHASQTFGPMLGAWVGMKAYLYTAAEVITLQVVAVRDGFINDTDLRGNDGTDLMLLGTYVAYTCKDRNKNVRAIGFAVTGTAAY